MGLQAALVQVAEASARRSTMSQLPMSDDTVAWLGEPFTDEQREAAAEALAQAERMTDA